MKVIAIWAQSIDGKLALDPQDNLKWVSKEDQAHFKEVTQSYGIIIMGKTTYDIIGKPLPGRLNVVLSKDVSLGFSEEIPNALAYANMPLPDLLDHLTKKDFSTICIAGGSTVYSQFAEQNLIDEYWITIEPYLFGQGISVLELKSQKKLILNTCSKLNNQTLLLQYSVSTE